MKKTSTMKATTVELGNGAYATIVPGARITLHGVKSDRLVPSPTRTYELNGKPMMVHVTDEEIPCMMHGDCIDHPEIGTECRRCRRAAGDTSNGILYSRTFEIGDLAEFDSYNLSYFATIVSITKKSVVVNDSHGKGKTSRMKIEHFSWRNWDFSAAEASEKNSDAMMYL
jgi:hypothetical protein